MSDTKFVWENTKQLSLPGLLAAVFVPSAIAFAGFHGVAPALVQGGMPSVYAWAAVAAIALAGFDVFALVLLSREARSLGIGLSKRLCLMRVSARMWLLSIGVMIAAIALSYGAKLVVPAFMRLFGLTIPSYTPFFLDPNAVVSPATAAWIAPGVVLKGNYGLLGLQALVLLLNISAEELYFRAWMLPKLSRYGRASWIVNGVFFALYHTFQIWMFPQLLVGSLAMAFVVWKTRSIWPAVAGHLVANFLLGILGMAALVFGAG
jgi:membrane protease YdiL (CAAX protease family)